MRTFASWLAGLVFGLGLMVSGMTNPALVLGFLDVAGEWNASLLLVMGGAVAVGMVAFAVARRRSVSWLGVEMKLPGARHIDRRLLAGSALFGVGWGLSGFCPGPALVALGLGEPGAWIFVASMLLGMGLFESIERFTTTTSAITPGPDGV